MNEIKKGSLSDNRLFNHLSTRKGAFSIKRYK